MTVIKFDNVSKRYRISQRHRLVTPDGNNVVTKSTRWSKLFPFNRDGRLRKEDFWALKDVSFEIKKGETIGIIGPNGAGKSTILKLLAGITRPSKGSIKTNGRIGSLIEVGAGFHPELTGRENIYLNASILGLKKREIDEKFDQIVQFAELEKFIDTPVKRYSSGMYVRLGFSVAMHIDPEILLIDEILAVGDKAFQRKSFSQLEKFKRDGKTFVLVSHNLFQVENICDWAIYLDCGKIIEQGNIKEVISRYVSDTVEKNKSTTDESQSEEIRLVDVRIVNESGLKTDTFYPEEPFIVEIDYIAHSDIESPTFVFMLRYGEFKIFSSNTKVMEKNLGILKGNGTIKCYVKNLPLMPNPYEVDVAVWDKQQIRMFSHLSNKASLTIKLPKDNKVIPYRAIGNMGVVYGLSEWDRG